MVISMLELKLSNLSKKYEIMNVQANNQEK